MKKILSFFAAMLCAVAVFADPVVLPATLDVSNVSFRSEGMPDFVLAEGDYAGTYFDMGAHDSSNDTLLYAEWDVTIEPLLYNISVDVYNTNSWSVRLHILNKANEEVKSLYYKGHSGEKGQFAIGSLDLRDLEAGDYKVRAHCSYAWSALKLKDVIFDADYSGATVALPGELFPAYAELSANASISNGAIAFKPSTAPDEYANWNVSFAKAGSYNVKIDITASNGHNYGVELIAEDEETIIGAVNEGGQKGDTGEKELGAIEVPAAGNYIVHLTNAIKWSEAVLNSITFAAPAPAHTYTVAGSSTDLFGTTWAPDNEANDMALQDDGTYKWEKTELTLAAGSIEFKVCEDHAWTTCWPSQNYVLNIAEAGIYTITITFEPANENKVDAVATKTGSAEVLPTIAMHGNFLGSWADTQNFTEAEDKATASLKLTIAAGNYEFGMRIGGSGNWTSNGVAFSRENNSAKIVAGQGNLTLAADAAGDYIFTWTYETETLAITFPEAEPELPYMAIIGDMNDWAGTELVPAEDKLTASATIHLDMNDNSGYGFKVLIGDKAYCIEPSGEWYSFHRGWTSASGIDHVATDAEAFWLSIDKAGDYTFTWTIAEKKLDITFPELLNITYYFVNTPDWEKVYAYAWSPVIADWPGEEATLQLGVSKKGHNVWAYTMPENRRNIVFNDGTGGEGHQTDDLTVEDGKPYFYDGVWYETLDDIPTSISDAEAKTSVQKMIENGQIVIIRNGEKFNAQGQVIR